MREAVLKFYFFSSAHLFVCSGNAHAFDDETKKKTNERCKFVVSYVANPQMVWLVSIAAHRRMMMMSVTQTHARAHADDGRCHLKRSCVVIVVVFAVFLGLSLSFKQQVT